MTLRMRGNLGTIVFMLLAAGVWAYGFPYENIWTFFCGTLLWLLGVANARITSDACKTKGE